MDVTSHCPLSIGALFWQTAPGAWVLTIVCKATYRLEPGTAQLHDLRDDIHREDVFWDDDRTRSLRAPCDLVPWKPLADVLVVGHAFADKGQAVASLVARVSVGRVDKSIELVRARGWNERGELTQGQPFTKKSLRYENAAGGPGTTNPVGVPAAPAAGMPASGALVRLPELQPVGFQLRDRASQVPSIGLGPLSLSWPEPLSRLGAHGAGLGPFSWRTKPVPRGLDLSCFQSAPTDQWTPHLRGDETLVLEHLHPDHALLRTRLPGLRPRAVLERHDGVARPLTAVADTLWLDTDRALATLSWRMQTTVLHPLEAGCVTITLETHERRRVESESRLQSLHASDLAAQWSRLPSRTDDGPAEVAPAEEAAAEDPNSQTARLPARSHPPPAATGLLSSLAAQTLPGALLGAGASLPFHHPPAPPPPAPPPPAPPPPAPLPLSPWAGGPVEPVVPEPSLGERLAGRAPPPPDSAAELAPIAGAGRQRMGRPGASEVLPDPRSALALSNAAVGAVATTPASGLAPAPGARPVSSEVIELLWFEPATPAKLRTRPDWKSLLPGGKQHPRDPGDERSPDERKVARHRREVVAVLKGATPRDAAGIDRAIKEAGEDGVFTAPILVVSGELEPMVDEVVALKATLTGVGPFVAGDKRLKETVDWAKEVLQIPGFESAGGVADGVIAKLKEAFGETRRSLPAGYLDTHVERTVLRQRAYQRRTLLGAEWLRCALRVAGGGESVAAYLPEVTANLLPMFRTFRIRAVVEARQSQEPGESVALSILAVATILK